MIKFGPSGNSASFTNEGHVSTLDAFEWVKNRKLLNEVIETIIGIERNKTKSGITEFL